MCLLKQVSYWKLFPLGRKSDLPSEVLIPDFLRGDWCVFSVFYLTFGCVVRFDFHFYIKFMKCNLNVEKINSCKKKSFQGRLFFKYFTFNIKRKNWSDSAKKKKLLSERNERKRSLKFYQAYFYRHTSKNLMNINLFGEPSTGLYLLTPTMKLLCIRDWFMPFDHQHASLLQ